MKILITGGAGFIGSHLVHFYIEKGFEVAVVDNFSRGQKSNLHAPFEKGGRRGICIFEGDILDVDFLEKTFQAFQPDIVSHHAAHISVPQSQDEPGFDAEQNIIGTINVAEAAGRAKVKQYILASSVAVYDLVDPVLPLTEKSPLHPSSPYGVAKLAAEQYVRFLAKKYGFTSTIFRYTNIYGPRQRPEGEAGVVAIFAESLKQNKSCHIFGNGTQTRDFLPVKEVCQAHFLATKQGLSGTFNLGSGTETSIEGLFETMKEAQKSSSKKIFVPEKKEALSRVVVDASPFQKASGWAGEVDFLKNYSKFLA